MSRKRLNSLIRKPSRNARKFSLGHSRGLHHHDHDNFVKNGGGSFGEYVKAGFGLGLGTIGAFIIAMIIAAALFIPGFIIVIRQNKLPKEERSTGMLVTGYILMALGMIIGLGFGASIFFGSLAENL